MKNRHKGLDLRVAWEGGLAGKLGHTCGRVELKGGVDFTVGFCVDKRAACLARLTIMATHQRASRFFLAPRGT